MSWEAAREIMGTERVLLGPQASYQWLHDPKHLLFVLARYKHAARLIGDAATVLEVGCGEGIGVGILAQHHRYIGIDPDGDAIDVAEATAAQTDVPAEFWATDLAGIVHFEPDRFDAVVTLDVVEHIRPDGRRSFIDALAALTELDGVCVIGTPNSTAAAYQSAASRAGHVGLLNAEDLRALLAVSFRTVQLFGMNDEVLHTGFLPMAHYLIGVGIGPRCETD